MAAVYGVPEFEFDEESDLKNYTVWLCDVVHGRPPFKPLYFIASWGRWAYYGFRYASELLCLPATKGWENRYIDGYPYLTLIEATDEEVKEREPIFREKMKPWIEDYSAVYEPLKAEIMKEYETLRKSFGLEEYEDIKRLSNIQLLMLFDDFTCRVDKREWEIHMMTMMPACYLFGLFQEMCRQLVGMSHIDPLFSKLMAGFDSQLFRINKEIWRLGDRAVELGLGETFQAIEDNEQLLTKLEESDAGRKWLGEYREFLKVHGWRCERMLEWSTPTWIEKPSLGIPSIRLSMAMGRAYTLDEKRGRLAKEREEAEKEILARVPAEQKEWFGSLMRAAQMAGYWSEDHTYYLDFYAGAIGRWITREYGRRFTEAGCIDDPEDVYFLLPGEIRRAAISMGRINLRRFAEMRKKEWEGYLEVEPKPFYGKIELVGEMIRKDATLGTAAAAPIVREELKADLYGAASAPGVVEGIAHVIMTVDKVAELQPGEILVAPGTSAPWTPAFGIISGVVTDGGGALAHAVIVAREYGIPCVAGCSEATTKIKTGDRVRLDGNLGVVYILG